jgi:hypothetical protein
VAVDLQAARGFIAPYVIGLIKQATGGTQIGLYFLGP